MCGWWWGVEGKNKHQAVLGVPKYIPAESQFCESLRFSWALNAHSFSSHPSSQLSISIPRMSRGGGRFGGRGGGRGGFAGGATQPPMGLTFADLQNLSREATALYPVCFHSTVILECVVIDVRRMGIVETSSRIHRGD